MRRKIRRFAPLVGIATIFAVSGCGMPPTNDSVNGALVEDPTPIPTESIAPSDGELPYDANDPTTWTNRQLVAQTIFRCASVSNVGALSKAITDCP